MLAPTVVASIKRFNAISKWVVFEVLMRECKAKARAAVIKKFIGLAGVRGLVLCGEIWFWRVELFGGWGGVLCVDCRPVIKSLARVSVAWNTLHTLYSPRAAHSALPSHFLPSAGLAAGAQL